MAKKTFNIKSTLNVQPKQFSVDDVESAIKQIHEAKTPAPPVRAEPARPKPPVAAKKAVGQKPIPQSATRREVVDEAPVRKVRLSVDIHPMTHKRLKIKAIEQDSDIMHYVEMLIERDLAK